MVRRSLVPFMALASLGQVGAFLPPASPLLGPACPAVRSSTAASTSVMRMAREPVPERDVSEQKPMTRRFQAGMEGVFRSLAAGATLVSVFLTAPAPSAALDIGRFGRQSTVDTKTVQKQLDRVDKKEQEELRDTVKDPTNVIAKGIVRLPEIEGYPLGPSTPGALNYALENDNAALLIACYGREGGPVAAKKIPLRGLEFPYAFELTADNLLFPLTKPTWEKDGRAFDDLGISALLDLDGKFASANENDLIGFGISKPVDIAGSQIRRDALILVQPRTGVKQYSDEELKVLGAIDLEIERQAQGSSLAQLAASSSSSIEVLTNNPPGEDAGTLTEQDLAGLE